MNLDQILKRLAGIPQAIGNQLSNFGRSIPNPIAAPIQAVQNIPQQIGNTFGNIGGNVHSSLDNIYNQAKQYNQNISNQALVGLGQSGFGKVLSNFSPQSVQSNVVSPINNLGSGFTAGLNAPFGYLIGQGKPDYSPNNFSQGLGHFLGSSLAASVAGGMGPEAGLFGAMDRGLQSASPYISKAIAPAQDTLSTIFNNFRAGGKFGRPLQGQIVSGLPTFKPKVPLKLDVSTPPLAPEPTFIKVPPERLFNGDLTTTNLKTSPELVNINPALVKINRPNLDPTRYKAAEKSVLNFDTTKDPVHVILTKNGELRVGPDGNHRIMAASNLGVKSLPIKLSYETGAPIDKYISSITNPANPIISTAPNAATIAEAEANGQLAVFDLKKFETVYTKHSPNYAPIDSSLVPQGQNSTAITPGGTSSLAEILQGPGSNLTVPAQKSLQEVINTKGADPFAPNTTTSSTATTNPAPVENVIGKVQNKVNQIYTETMDRFHPLSVLAKKGGEDLAMRRALTGYYGTGSTANYHVNYELSPILKGNNVDDLRTAAIALRDIELSGRNIQGSNTIDEIFNGPTKSSNAQGEAATARIQALKEKLGPQGMASLGDSLKKLYAYQDNLVQEYLVKNGIMSKEQFAGMKSKNQFYVPFQRVMDQVDEYLGVPKTRGAGSVGSQNAIFGIKGSDKQIQDPIESIVENTYKIVGVGKRQEVARTIVSLKDKLPEGMITKVLHSGKDTISVFENGKAQHYQVPIEVADAAKGMSEEQMNTMVKVLAAPTHIFRATATGLNPEFLLPNVARDLQSAFVNVGLNPLKWVSGLAHMAKQDEVYQEFLKAGGMSSRVSIDRPFLSKTVAEITGQKQGLRITDPRRLFALIERLGQYSEQPTRIASFEQSLQKGLKNGLDRTGALADAANAAQEGTVNFARRGSKTQGLNMIYAFLNARAQGTDKLLRSLKNDPKGAGLRLGLITAAPAIALYAWNKQFSSYNDPRIVPDNVKQNNFVIMLGDTPNSTLGGAQYAMIPKGEVGKLANPVENFLSFIDGKGGDVQKSFLSALQSFSPIQNTGDIIPTALRPGVENAANFNFFQNSQIVPDSKKNYPAAYQFSKNTPPIYKEIGARLNVSPNQVQNVMRGYLTGYARLGEMATTPFAKQDAYSGQDINQIPIARRFLGGAVRTEDEQQLNDFFKQKGIMNKVDDIKTGVRRGDIPIDEGMKQIDALINQTPVSPNNPSYFGPKETQASDQIGQNNKVPVATTINPKDAMKKQLDYSKAQLKVETTGQPQTVGDRYLYLDPETGKAASYSLSGQKNSEVMAQYQLTADKLQKENNFTDWTKATENQINYLDEYKKTLTEPQNIDDAIRVEKSILDLKSQLDKYKGYGGFKKGKKKSSKALNAIFNYQRKLNSLPKYHQSAILPRGSNLDRILSRSRTRSGKSSIYDVIAKRRKSLVPPYLQASPVR